MDDKDNEPTNQLVIDPVVSVSDGLWTKHRSKKQGGKSYYFNIETGQSVWDLNPEEIEKERQNSMQKIIKNPKKTGGTQSIPKPPTEPYDSGQRHFEQNPTPSKIYNKQIINNSYIRPPPPITAFVVPTCSHGMPTSGLADPKSSTVLSIAGSSNYNIWTVPNVGHQIIVAPPIAHQIQTNALCASTQTSESFTNSNERHDDITEQNTQIFTERECPSSPSHLQHDKYIPKVKKTSFGQKPQVEESPKGHDDITEQNIQTLPYHFQSDKYIPKGKNKFGQRAQFEGIHLRNYIMEQNTQTFTEGAGQTSQSHFQSNKFIPRVNKTLFGQSPQGEEIRNKNEDKDLRHFLSSRRMNSRNRNTVEFEDDRSEEIEVMHYNTSYAGTGDDNISYAGTGDDNTSHGDTSMAYETCEESCYSDADCDWLENNVTVQGKQLRLNVASLKSLAGSNTDPNQWYIAVDKVILLRHLNFLNTLYHSDEQCHLLVPRLVLDELRAEARARGARRTTRRAHRALAFILQQLEAGTAIIGTDSCESSNTDIPYNLSCCINLAKQRYHVVLISNSDLQRYKNITRIPIFSIKELKEYLSRNDQEEDDDELETEQFALLDLASTDLERVKIVIPNDPYYKTARKNIEDKTTSDIDNKRQNKPQGIQENKSNDKHSSTYLKDSVANAGVQTELPSYTFTDPIVHNDNTNTANIVKKSNAISCTVRDMNTEKAGHSSQSTNVSRIRLNRSITNPPTHCIAKSVEKKQFKWRKRRAIHTNESNLTHIANRTEETTATVPECAQTTKTSERLKMDENLNRNRSASRQNNVSCDVDLERNETFDPGLQMQNLIEKLVVEEASTSGVVSNTESNVDSARSSVDKETINRDIMFGVTDHSMEEHLTMRSDEWVSRYVQIMEEVLSQVLRQYLYFSLSITPPPWTLHEATKCIGALFKDKKDVVIAAKMLLKVLENVCDTTKNRICIDIKPSDYMQLYSYGVYLVETLQLVVQNCEDLHTATESLSKLLYDIKNPNLDSSHNLHRNSATIPQAPNVRLEDTEAVNRKEHAGTTKKKVLLQKSKFKESYNLRSQTRRMQMVQQEKEPEKQSTTFVINADTEFRAKKRRLEMEQQEEESDNQSKIVGNVDFDFFMSLNLQRKDDSNTILNDPSIPPNVLSEQLSPNSQSFSRNLSRDKEASQPPKDCTSESINKGIVELKITNKFKVCPEFEERLAKSPESPINTHTLNDSEYYEDEYNNTEENVYYGLNKNERKKETDENQDRNGSENKSSKNSNLENGNSYYKCFLRQIINETKETIMRTTVLCKNTGLELSNDHLPTNKKIAVLEQAEKAYQRIDSIHQKLCCILEQKYEEKSIPLRKAGIHFNFGDKQLLHYRDKIQKYITEVKTLLSAVNSIIAAVKTLLR